MSKKPSIVSALITSGIAAMAAVGIDSPLDMTEDEMHGILRGPMNPDQGKSGSTFDAREFLDGMRARQDQKRQAREVAKRAGTYHVGIR